MITNEPYRTGLTQLTMKHLQPSELIPIIVHQLDHMADSLDRSRNYLVNQAIKEYLQTHDLALN